MSRCVCAEQLLYKEKGGKSSRKRKIIRMPFAVDPASDNEALHCNSRESDAKDLVTCPRTQVTRTARTKSWVSRFHPIWGWRNRRNSQKDLREILSDTMQK